MLGDIMRLKKQLREMKEQVKSLQDTLFSLLEEFRKVLEKDTEILETIKDKLYERTIFFKYNKLPDDERNEILETMDENDEKLQDLLKQSDKLRNERGKRLGMKEELDARDLELK